MSPTHDNSIYFDGDGARDRAFSAWAIADIQSRQGMGLGLGSGAKRSTFGRNGVWRMKGALGAIAGLATIEVVLAGAGCSAPLWALIFAGPYASSAARSLEGATSAWRRARAEGRGLLASFGSMCHAEAKSFAADVTPNAASPRFLASGLVELALALAGTLLSPRGKGPLAASIAGARKRAVAFSLSVYEGPWAAGEARKAARIDAALLLRERSDVALVLYRRLAAAYLRHQLLLDPWVAGLSEDELRAYLDPARRLARDTVKPMISAAPCQPEDLESILDLVQAAGIPPWWSPVGHAPTLAELAHKLRVWQRIKKTGETALDIRVSGLGASCEANLIDSALPAPASAAPARRPVRI